MATTVHSAALCGVSAVPVEVEVDLLRRLPAVSIVGLPASAVRESAERVRSAIEASGHDFPRQRVVINLAPADLRKEGTALDLPVALAILAASGIIPAEATDRVLAAGELALDGRLRPIRGALSLALAARDADRVLIVPAENAGQAAMVPGLTVWGAKTLAEVVSWLCGAAPEVTVRAQPVPRPHGPDLKDVKGQPLARRALEIAAAGAHHLLLVGPPGCGKSMLARRLPSILPPLTFEEALQTTQIHSAGGLLNRQDGVLRERPFRAPHHTVTVAGLVGDRTLRPGEVTLAHNGVLFLDEAAEFRRSALEVLRQPLEDGELQITRAAGTVVFPAKITLVLASNPCPCGFLGSDHPCGCNDHLVQSYRRRLSGPILDRIDLHVELRALPPTELLDGEDGECSDAVRARVEAARDRQQRRGQQGPNAQLNPEALTEFARFAPRALDLLRQGAEHHRLSARATRRLQKVARTVADLADSLDTAEAHVAEALAFRPLAGVV